MIPTTTLTIARGAGVGTGFNMLLSELWHYPVKSLRGIQQQSLAVDGQGFQYDRHWMLVDTNGKFLSQRVLPRMALINTAIEQNQLRLSAPQQEDLLIPLAEHNGQNIPVTIWRDQCNAQSVSHAADFWLSDFLKHNCRLVYLPEAEKRRVDPAYALPTDRVEFADGYPFMLISQASLDDLNTRLQQPMSMQRFRPNLVIDGCAPYAEDHWKQIKIGDLYFRLVKSCARCNIPTVDIASGTYAGDEPIKTLSTYRMQEGKIMLGQNLLHDGGGRLEVGMPVEIIS